MTNLLGSIIEDNPFHQEVVIGLPLVGFNEARNELRSVIGCRDDGYNHDGCDEGWGLNVKFRSYGSNGEPV